MKHPMKPAGRKIFNVPLRAWKALWPLGRISGLFSLLAIGIYCLLLLPSEDKLKSLHRAYIEERKQFSELRIERKTQKELLRVRKDLQQAWNVLPEKKDFASIALAISQLASDEKVMIPGMSYSQTQIAKALPQKASLTFSATGTYPSIYRFIHQLEESKQYLIIEHLTATQTNSSLKSKTGNVRFNMKVSTFLKDDIQIGKTS